MSAEMSAFCHRHTHGDSCSDPVAQDAQALVQLAEAAAEAEATSGEAAGAAGPEPAIPAAAADHSMATQQLTALPEQQHQLALRMLIPQVLLMLNLSAWQLVQDRQASLAVPLLQPRCQPPG